MAFDPSERAARVITRELANVPAPARTDFLKSLMAHTAASLTNHVGQTECAESLYRFADAAATRGKSP